MSTLRWNPGCDTGIDDVGGQHHHILNVIGEFTSRLEQRSDLDAATLADVYADLARYARHHFATEEKLMAEVGVDARHLLHHRSDHEYFEAHIQELATRTSESAATAARQLLDFLMQWLAYHILGSDQSMARQVKAIRAGCDPAEALARADRPVDLATATLLHSLQALFQVLSERNRELTELTASLEQRVVERTEALSAANLELKQMVAQVEHAAMTDFLTGLPNRRYAMERLAQSWALSVRHGHPLSCLLLDADGFKQVNDTHGHLAGDEILKALAAALRSAVRSGDEVCRFGGDEFLVIAPETPLPGALSLGERIRASVAQLRVPDGAGVWQGSVSVGVASRRTGLDDLESLLRAADHGVYAAKRAGRNAVRAGDEQECSPGTPPAER